LGLSLALSLLLSHCLSSWGLRCMQCDSIGCHQAEECALGQELCRTTVLVTDWLDPRDEEELEVVERGCTHSEKTNRTMSYRTGSQIISLTETVCGFNLCNQPKSGEFRSRNSPYGRYLECVSCTSSDMSCERGREQSLQCRYPGEQCVEVVTHRSLEGEPPPATLHLEQVSPGTLLAGCFSSMKSQLSHISPILLSNRVFHGYRNVYFSAVQYGSPYCMWLWST
uniref:Plasminogen activator, urokinase receptor n=1 Tax=Spermophilus dauricus TaxID=99837 RepID=A0A8C9PH59_SPEDA